MSPCPRGGTDYHGGRGVTWGGMTESNAEITEEEIETLLEENPQRRRSDHRTKDQTLNNDHEKRAQTRTARGRLWEGGGRA